VRALVEEIETEIGDSSPVSVESIEGELAPREGHGDGPVESAVRSILTGIDKGSSAPRSASIACTPS
jgi:hypothetical protein